MSGPDYGILRFMTIGKALSVSMSGLSEVEAQTRLQSEGHNELPRQDQRTPLRIVLEVFREPMFALLLGGGFIYLLLGDLKEALILLGFAIMSVAITVIQETRTERVLEALRDLTSPRALVIRDGVRRRIAGRGEVARGDLVVLAEGDRVPADAVVVQARDLQADKSLLTGESVPVRKIAATRIPASGARPGGDDQPFVYSGAMIVRGSGLAQVVATGPRSEIGKIGQSLHALKTEPPHLQAQTATTGADGCAWRSSRQHRGGLALRHVAGRMAGCGARWDHHRHVYAAGRVSGRTHRVHGYGGVADFKSTRAHPARRFYRNARVGHGVVYGQDRHADREPNVNR